ncbi:hypothetical protein SAMN04489729_0235 [Amycolatopsis lurida]|uniref:Uncharacterized protein n=1 Tax=Amycolatopsis lurida NRRL 2430 TaxID=1460371 RepID=A0A2P2FYU2_AMYLU|nr:hypothetical protein BB31_08555 [Amycolatopsis lurida NRRL 2430]SEB32267.1 hypothetical protein SAMN04489729_0235 [Amycolatopsis lurida]
MGKVEYLVVLAACGPVTLPLKIVGARVHRQPKRLARALLPVAMVFLVRGVMAIAGEVWSYAPFSLPLEEILFFVVIPICGMPTLAVMRPGGRIGSPRGAAAARTAPPARPYGRIDRQFPGFRSRRRLGVT